MSRDILIRIKICPTCGSDKIQRAVRNVTRKHKGQTYMIPALEFHECPICGAKVYDSAAMRKIETYSPVYRKAGALAEV